MNDILKTIEQVKAETAQELEATRILTICNACRYCEGFCAVFPAMTQMLSFDKADVHYLAHLCHNCGACLHACQYAPPHEFAVNVPQTMAKVRMQTYADYAWPSAMGHAYKKNGLVVALALALGLTLFLLLAIWMNPIAGVGWVGAGLQANFYAIFPHNMLAWMFGIVFGFALLAMGMSAKQFWRTIHLEPTQPNSTKTDHKTTAMLNATKNALTLQYLDGGHGEGCNDGDDAFTHLRRRLHHCVFYGFMLCFAATSVATFYHYAFGWQAPYAYNSLPVLLGTAGGVLLVIGTAGMAWLQAKRYKAFKATGLGDHSQQYLQHDPQQQSMDSGLVALLLLTSLTGLILLVARESIHMPWLLAVHLGVVMALFLTLPYGKMMHGIYRYSALVKFKSA